MSLVAPLVHEHKQIIKGGFKLEITFKTQGDLFIKAHYHDVCSRIVCDLILDSSSLDLGAVLQPEHS